MSKRVIFMGTPEFAVPSLQQLHTSDLSVAAVITGPPKPVGRGRRLQNTPVHVAAESLGIPVLTVQKLKDPDFLEQYRALEPDVAAVVAFRILPESLLRIPALGTINLHGSLLPRYRGAAPIQRALMEGEAQTGLTTFVIDVNVDTGGMLSQVTVDIQPDETFGDLSGRMAAIGADLLEKTIRRHCSGESSPVAQDGSLATLAPKILPEDCRIDWRRSAVELHNLVRALSPAPGAVTWSDDSQLKILRSHVVTPDGSGSQPGTVILAHPRQGVHVQCGIGILEITEVVKAGKKTVTGKQFAGGRQILQHEVLN